MTDELGTYERFFTERNAPCLEAARWVDHALNCSFCKEALVGIGLLYRHDQVVTSGMEIVTGILSAIQPEEVKS